MKLVFTSYASTPEYHDPASWLKRIEGYVGILESLSKYHEVIGIEHINYEGEYERNGVRYYFIKLNKPVIRIPWRMHKRIHHLKPDIVFVNGFIFPLQLIQLKWKLGKRTKIIVINHAERPTAGFRKFFQRFADRYVNAYLFASQEMGMEWVKGGIISDGKKIAEVMEASSSFKAIDKKVAFGKTGAVGDPVFLWVGRLDANKDPLTVLRGFSEFIKYSQSAFLYMIYHTEELKPQLEKYIQENEFLRKKVKLIGALPHDELLYWYASSDFIISGSHHEGAGIAVCEAMSCGCIPVLTDIHSFRMMTAGGQCGLLYEAGNAGALLQALSKTRAMNLAEEKQKVLSRFEKKLSYDAIARDINAVVESIKS